MGDHLKLIRLLLYPFLLFSLAIYLCLNLLSPLKFAFQISLPIGLILTFWVYYWERPNWTKSFILLFSWRSFLLLVPVIFLLFTFGFVLSPLVKTIIFEGHRVLGLTALGDYYKHLYVLTAIKTGGLPPHHPFFPSASLSYYYGYYLLPAAISSVFSFDLSRVFFFYLLLTTLIILLVVIRLSMAIFGSWYQRFLSLTLFIFGSGLDIIPTLIQAKAGILTANHIEFWSQILNLNNYLVNNLYTVLLWVPQHSLPSLIVMVTGFMLIKEKKVPLFWLISAIWFCLISSTFVSVSFIIWLGLIFLFLPHTRFRLVISGVMALSLLLPYLIELSSRGSILSFGFYMTPFRYLPFFPAWINYTLTFMTEYGLIILAIPLFYLTRRKKNRTEAALVTLAILLPIVLGLFVKSSGFNDYSMRSVLPSQMALPFLMAYCLARVETSFWKKTLFLILALNLIPSMTGLFYEIHFRLIDRSIIEASTSDLLLNLRHQPVSNLAVIDNGDWIFLIPSYGYQPVYSPRLFDSGGYLAATGLKEQSTYENQVNKLFINRTLGKDYLSVARERQSDIQNLNVFFSGYQTLNFVLPQYRGKKTGFNPWIKVFAAIGVTGNPLTDQYSLYKGIKIDQILKSNKISLNMKHLVKKEPDQNNRFFIRSGLWFVIACRQPKSTHLSLDFTDYYALFDINLDSSQDNCAGDLYYQSKDENITISKTSDFKSLYLVPLRIN